MDFDADSDGEDIGGAPDRLIYNWTKVWNVTFLVERQRHILHGASDGGENAPNHHSTTFRFESSCIPN